MSSVNEYKCPCCGGAISFDSNIQKMKCPFCDTEFDIDTLKSYDEGLNSMSEEDIHWDKTAGNEWQEDEQENLRVYICNSCGGEIVGDETTAATSCPYCDNPVVFKGQLSGELKPDFVIPFKVDKKAAKQGLNNHLKGKRLLPKIFKNQNHVDEIKGIYVPFWLFDTDVDANAQYKATKTRRWSDSNYDYTETKFFSVFRSGNIGFENIPVDGSQKMLNELMEAIEPFDFNDAVDFQTAYLAGYFADKYDVGAEESVNRANERIKQSAQEALRGTVTGYSSVVPENVNIKLINGCAKYALYPVWILNTTWQGEKYTFAMNGQTGKFVGDLPVDKGAYVKWLFGLTGAIGAAAFAASYLLWLL